MLIHMHEQVCDAVTARVEGCREVCATTLFSPARRGGQGQGSSSICSLSVSRIVYHVRLECVCAAPHKLLCRLCLAC